MIRILKNNKEKGRQIDYNCLCDISGVAGEARPFKFLMHLLFTPNVKNYPSSIVTMTDADPPTISRARTIATVRTIIFFRFSDMFITVLSFYSITICISSMSGIKSGEPTAGILIFRHFGASVKRAKSSP